MAAGYVPGPVLRASMESHPTPPNSHSVTVRVPARRVPRRPPCSLCPVPEPLRAHCSAPRSRRFVCRFVLPSSGSGPRGSLGLRFSHVGGRGSRPCAPPPPLGTLATGSGTSAVPGGHRVVGTCQGATGSGTSAVLGSHYKAVSRASFLLNCVVTLLATFQKLESLQSGFDLHPPPGLSPSPAGKRVCRSPRHLERLSRRVVCGAGLFPRGRAAWNRKDREGGIPGGPPSSRWPTARSLRRSRPPAPVAGPRPPPQLSEPLPGLPTLGGGAGAGRENAFPKAGCCASAFQPSQAHPPAPGTRRTTGP